MSVWSGGGSGCRGFFREGDRSRILEPGGSQVAAAGAVAIGGDSAVAGLQRGGREVRRRSALETILWGFLGAGLGGLISGPLLFEIQHWTAVLPMALGAVATMWKEDRALLRLTKLIQLLPG